VALLRQPSASTRRDWVYQNVEAMILHGDTLGEIVDTDRLGWPTQIELIHPSSLPHPARPRPRGRWRSGSTAR